MKITHLNSATQIIDFKGVKILTDPWLGEPIYYNSWVSYPPFDEDNAYMLDNIDYVYISHLHEDHFSEETLLRLDKETKFIVFDFSEKTVFNKLKRFGFNDVKELKHGERTLLKNNVYINIFAADNCDPEVCLKSFGCFMVENKKGGTYQIDSLCVIEDGNEFLLNTNDCPYPIAKNVINVIKKRFKKIDFMLVGYTSASLFPFSMADYNDKKKHEAKLRTRKKALDYTVNYIEEFRPKYFMPHAGTYYLAGKNWGLNKFSPVPEYIEAKSYIESQLESRCINATCILLNQGKKFDTNNYNKLPEYVPINVNTRDKYIKNTLSKVKYTFEKNETPISNKMVIEKFMKAWSKFLKKIDTIGFKTNTMIKISCGNEIYFNIDLSENNQSYKIKKNIQKKEKHPFIEFLIDKKLFYLILKGPRYAHWNSVENANLLRIKRNPDKYEMGIHMAMCYLHE